MNNMDIAERIRNARAEKGMTQEELAKAAGYKSRATINKIELGKRSMTLDGAKRIARALNVDPDYLVFGNAEDKKAEIESLFEMLNPDQQDAVLSFLRTLLGATRQG